MKNSLKVTSVLTGVFSFVHTYLWAFGFWEPKHEWFGCALALSYVGAFFGLVIAHEMEG